MIAASEYGLQPECHIYQMPGKKLTQVIPMQTTLRSSAMAFSRNGNYLIIIGGIPDFRISIYDLKEQKFLPIPNTKLPFKYTNMRSVSFNPRNQNEFSILSDTTIYFYTLKAAFQLSEKFNTDEEDDSKAMLADSYRLEVQTFSANDIPNVQNDETQMPVIFHSLKWDQYSRVHVCSNLTQVLQITSFNPHLEQAFELGSVPYTTLLTQKHLIVSTDDGQIKWFKIEPPYESPDGKFDPQTQFLKILPNEEQVMDFIEAASKSSVQSADGQQQSDPAAYMKYTRSHKKIVIGTQNGLLAVLPEEAELLDEDEDEDGEAKKEQQIKHIDEPLQIIGRYHTAVVRSIKHLPKSSQFITISDDGTMAIWESTTGQQVFSVGLHDVPTSMNVTNNGMAAFIGTSEGALLIFDISNRSAPRLVKQFRLFFDQKKEGEQEPDSIPISYIQCSQDGNLVIIGSLHSDKVFVISQQSKLGFVIMGHFKMDGFILSLQFIQHENKLYAAAVLSNNLVQVALLPNQIAEDRMNPLPEDVYKRFIRKVDRGTNLILTSLLSNKVFVSGEDKYLKQYDLFPTDNYHAVDWRKPAIQPNEEYPSHGIGTTCVTFNYDLKKMITGGKDGLLISRSPDSIKKIKDYQVYSVVSEGISAVSVDEHGFAYVAGFDGSIFVISLENQDFPQRPVQAPINQEDPIHKITAETIKNVSEIKLYTEILKEEFEMQNAEKKAQFKASMMSKLAVIQQKLQDLLKENEQVTEIEKLAREEFCIDIDSQQKVILEGDEQCNKIKKEADMTCLRLELYRERIKEQTWDNMEVQQRAVKSISSEEILHNFSIRKKNPEEQKILAIIIRQRQIELTEKYKRIEANMKEVLDEHQFTKFKEAQGVQEEGYFLNRMAGKPEFMDNDAIAQAVEEFARKEAEKKAKRNAEQQSQVNQNSKDEGKRKPYIRITKGKLGTKTRKAAGDGDGASKQQVQQRDIKGMDEIHYKVVYIQKELEYLKATLENPNIYDILYNAFELYTDKRKRSQIELLKECVIELKRDYNKQFDEFSSYKQEQIFLLQEKNEQVKELQQNLAIPIDIFIAKEDKLEKPDHIFEVKDDEIKVEKYLTKEERARLAEAERIRLEREALLSGDNVGQRGLKEMMGGNELVFKKDKNALDQEFQREPWMDKKEDDMNDDEKTKLKEFLQREKEYLDKRRKAWDQQLKKVQSDIFEIQTKFEERLLMLKKKRLFFEARVLEQELYIIRLNVQLHEVRETRVNAVKYSNEFEELHSQLEEKQMFIQSCTHQMQDFEQKITSDKTIQIQKDQIKQLCQAEQLNQKQIQGFVEHGKTLAIVQIDEAERQKLNQHIVNLDPLSLVDKLIVKEIIAIKESDEVYDFERDRPGEVIREQFEKFVEFRLNRLKINRIIESNQKKLRNLKDFLDYLEKEFKDLQETEAIAGGRSEQFRKRLEKLKYNFEVVVYLKQGQVEVPQAPVATDYKDAILIDESVINKENADIKMRGDKKVDQLISIHETETKLKQVKNTSKRLALEITDYEERSKDVQLYRVTKQTQEIIQGQGKSVKKDDEEKKKQEKQIEHMELSTASRIQSIIKMMKKIKKETAEKREENRQLEEKARQLKENVDQRDKILQLKTNQQRDNSNDPSKKLSDIADSRKMLDKIKRQEEEIMFLSEELDRLRARTFPSFAHLQSKPEYPDDR